VPDERVTPALLQSVASLTLLSFITPKALVKVAVEQALRIENVIESLLKRVGDVKTVSLQSLASGAKSLEEQKKTLIVNFIALLELLRTGAIFAHQENEGGDIEMSAKDITSPNQTTVEEDLISQMLSSETGETALSTTFSPLEIMTPPLTKKDSVEESSSTVNAQNKPL
jgi:hypothetical protein